MSDPFRCGRRRVVRAPARRAPFVLPPPLAATRGPLAAACVSAAAGLALAAPPVAAQAPAAAPPAPLEQVTVTATRTPTRVSDAVAEVTVLEREDVERATGRTLAELLAREPGLQVSANGGLGKTSGVFIRGLEARHTLLLVDGVRLGSATVGTPSFDNLPLPAIDRIEIVRGPLSSVYGSEAVGGVVQVFTRRGEPGLVPNAFASVGTNRFAQLGGGLAFGSGAFDGAFQLVHTGTDGFSATNPSALFGTYNPDRDGFRQNAGSFRLGWQFTPDWRVEGFALESDGETQYDDGPGVDSRAKLRNGVQSLAVSGRVLDGWRTRLSYGRSTDVYDTLATASPFTPLGATRTTQTQLGWENTFATPLGRLLALVERIEQDVSRPGQPYTVGDRTIDAVGLGLAGEAGRHAWQGGVRHDDNSQFGGQTTGSLGYGFALTPTLRAGASYGTSFVAPSFNQLYFPGFGNPTLLPEEGRHGELSLRWSSGAQTLRGAWVDNRIRSYIPSGPLPVNVPSTRIDGLVMSWEGRWSGLVAGASYERLDPRNTTEGPDFGKQLVRRAKDAFRMSADWMLGEYSIGGTLSAFSERYEDAANRLRMGGFTTLDLRADWRYDRAWTAGVRVNNLADKVYETAYGFNQPGREMFVTLRWSPPGTR
ncbi:MAG: TonB-dependent receptor [Solirubrobacteraceae bacterium]|nr:TonB-dependent receptor [Solirubrobacteraceae bacterium]